ncbi:unnamed protein product [Nezara viridula]|uniref:Uncharacterized protein n=1 Tax=Nezara viridula TaxID=85310 RepID=A0A9P0H2F5_NEZVI|nr:unnamed protein product [Nezara viridula]
MPSSATPALDREFMIKKANTKLWLLQPVEEADQKSWKTKVRVGLRSGSGCKKPPRDHELDGGSRGQTGVVEAY